MIVIKFSDFKGFQIFTWKRCVELKKGIKEKKNDHNNSNHNNNNNAYIDTSG